ncbi:MAG: xanthine dehydrogenase accessory protein XdhC [Phycisphaerae bacterium]|nr:xanthine dehydrogenase accessory protein XdhC [Phycisphaerae bacterium]MDZ4829422.1 xanthine dehydrogenase accessory protein XdhC [Phycisphaerae bacterium]
MSNDREVLRSAAELNERGQSYVLVTVVTVQGSTPRNPGAKMLWHPNGSAGGGWIGTVGGGQFERLVQDDADKHLRARSCGVERYVLGADADQCCGGVMEVFFEGHGPCHRAVIFGAGHVSFELARLLEPAPLQVVIVDDRTEWNNQERFPRALRFHSFDEGVKAACERTDATLACVMTCSHDTDFELLRALLVNPPAFVGLIGSRSKRACLFGRLVASGASEESVRRVQCPIGVGDTGKEPPLVAVSIAAQLLMESKQLAQL